MKKRIFLLLLCLALLLTGCAASRRTPKQTFRIYGLSGAPGGDAISAVDVDWSERKSLTVDQQAQAALEQLLGACTEPGYRTPIPQGVTLRSCQLTGGMALVDFSQGYEQLSGIDLTIADYCVTLTLSQLPGISVVRITVEGQDLAYRTHSLLQSREVLMTSEDDVTRTLGVRLFFPARESGLLTSESRTLTLHEGDSAVEAIMSALMEGPQTDEPVPSAAGGLPDADGPGGKRHLLSESAPVGRVPAAGGPGGPAAAGPGLGELPVLRQRRGPGPAAAGRPGDRLLRPGGHQRPPVPGVTAPIPEKKRAARGRLSIKQVSRNK